MLSKGLRFPIIILTLTLGVSVLTTGCGNRGTSSHQSVLTTNTEGSSTLPTANASTTRSGNVLIRFKEFEFRKDWAADFEIINDTTTPVYFVGDNTDGSRYCTLAARRQDNDSEIPAVIVRNFCVLGNRVALQTLQPGQSAVLAANKNEIRDLLHIKDLSSTVAAEIGFEVFVASDRHRHIVWSDQVTFPNQDPR